jgi:hypothetical protein
MRSDRTGDGEHALAVIRNGCGEQVQWDGWPVPPRVTKFQHAFRSPDHPGTGDAYGGGGRMTSSSLHPGLSARWTTFSLLEQMGNLGSEVGRTIRAHQAGNADRFGKALARALELFDLTASDPRWRGARRREICRAREEFCRLFFDEEVAPGSAAGLERYFLHFAAAANRHRPSRP